MDRTKMSHDGLPCKKNRLALSRLYWIYECAFLIFQLRRFFVQNFSHFSLRGYLRYIEEFLPKILAQRIFTLNF